MSNALQSNVRNLSLLLWDEFKGFAKSKTIIAMWVGMPIIVLLIHFLSPSQSELPVTLFSALLIGSIGGVLASVIIGTTMTNEITRNVYALYFIRPVKRWQIILSKYIAIMLSLIIASFLSFGVGIVVDSIQFSIETASHPDFIRSINDLLTLQFLDQTPIFREFFADIINLSFENLLISLSAMSIACTIGLVIGILSKSIAMSAILSFYLGQQISVIAVLPGVLLENIDPLYFSLGVGFAATVILLSLGMLIFRRKQF
jgi:ABC-type transport system involved in multi-copper enzyme maturation permease subunit